MGYLGAWYAFRHNNAWAAALGTGTALVVAVSYGDSLGRYFFVYAPAAVLLVRPRARRAKAAGVGGGRNRAQPRPAAGLPLAGRYRRGVTGDPGHVVAQHQQQPGVQHRLAGG